MPVHLPVREITRVTAASRGRLGFATMTSMAAHGGNLSNLFLRSKQVGQQNIKDR